MPTKDKEKNREYQRKWYLANKEKQKQKNYARRRRITQKLKDYKSKLCCTRCGECHPSCLDFHHKNPIEKEIPIYLATSQGWGWEKIKEEIDKCEVLCSNCHRKEHWEGD